MHNIRCCCTSGPPSKTPSDGMNFDEVFGNLESCPKSLKFFKTYANVGSSAHGNLVVLIILKIMHSALWLTCNRASAISQSSQEGKAGGNDWLAQR